MREHHHARTSRIQFQREQFMELLCVRGFFLAANKGPVADIELPRRTREKASGTQGAGYITN